MSKYTLHKTSKYDDIINLPTPTSAQLPGLSLYERASQYSPFASLCAHVSAIKETARRTDEQRELEEDALNELNQRLRFIQESPIPPEVTLTYFEPDKQKSGGAYQTICGMIKRIDEFDQSILMEDRTRIKLSQILAIECALFDEIEQA